MTNSWDERYREPGYAYGKNPNDFLVSSLAFLPPTGSVLCLAEGEGRNGVFLAEKGYAVTAVDSSAEGLKKAEALAAERGVSLVTCVADLADYKLPLNRYDAIVSIFCHLPPPVRRRVFAQIPASLKKHGVFVLEGYTPRQLKFATGGPPVPELLYELDEIRSELQDLRLLSGMEVEREIVEGKLHTGLGSVVQVIAVKD